MTVEELEQELLALGDAVYDALVDRVTRERRRRLYAEFEARHRPLEIAHHQKHLDDHLPAQPYCREFEDGLDGYVVHAEQCPNWPRSWLSSPQCIGMVRVR